MTFSSLQLQFQITLKRDVRHLRGCYLRGWEISLVEMGILDITFIYFDEISYQILHLDLDTQSLKKTKFQELVKFDKISPN